jgi:hypothetical protein
METTNENEPRYMTQEEVAQRFRVSPSTVKNWRDKGLLEYLQPPGSTRVLYPRKSIEEFESQYRQKSNVTEFRRPVEISGTKPEVSSKSEKKDWRI